MCKKRRWCFPFQDGRLIFFTAYRANKGFLHIPYPDDLCWGDAQLFPDKLIAQMFHFGITVRTDTFFFRDITWNFYYGKGLVQIGTDGFLLSDPFMLFYNCRWLRLWDGFFYWLGSLCLFTG